jgi:ribose 1,5-bisphosphokinase PhnN
MVKIQSNGVSSRKFQRRMNFNFFRLNWQLHSTKLPINAGVPHNIPRSQPENR